MSDRRLKPVAVDLPILQDIKGNGVNEYYVKILGFSILIDSVDGSGMFLFKNGNKRKASTRETMLYMNIFLRQLDERDLTDIDLLQDMVELVGELSDHVNRNVTSVYNEAMNRKG